MTPDGVSDLPDTSVSTDNGFQRAHLKVVPSHPSSENEKSQPESEKNLESFVKGILNKKKRFDRRGVAIRAYEKAALLKPMVVAHVLNKSV